MMTNKSDLIQKLKELYKIKDSLVQRKKEIKELDPIYKINSEHYLYDEKYGKEYKELDSRLNLICKQIALIEDYTGVGVFMTDRGIMICTLK